MGTITSDFFNKSTLFNSLAFDEKFFLVALAHSDHHVADEAANGTEHGLAELGCVGAGNDYIVVFNGNSNTRQLRWRRCRYQSFVSRSIPHPAWAVGK